MRGFESYNQFKVNIRDSRQLYDITYHLYQSEKDRIEILLKSSSNTTATLNTSINSIEHGTTSLYQRLENSYPYKLRQLLLISVISSLEVFLTDVILEIFARDMSPFKKDEPVTFQKNYLLSVSSINKIKEDIISKDFRNLTSGGLLQIEKYFKKMFNVDFRNLNISFKEVDEIHTRRHLFVHRNGLVDMEYLAKFPEYQLKLDERIKLSHSYLIESINKISEFAGLINKALITQFPEINRRPQYLKGEACFDSQLKKIMIEVSILEEKFDHLDFFQNLTVRDKQLKNYIVQIVTLDNVCCLFVCGKQSEISSFFKAIIDHKSLSINKTIAIL